MTQIQGKTHSFDSNAGFSGINCVLAASSLVLLTSELIFYKVMLFTLPLLALGSIRRFLPDLQICIHGLYEVAKSIASHREALDYLLPLGDQASQVARMVKNLPAMQETRVRSLGQEDPLEKGMTTHSCILAWRIPWTEEPGGLQSMGSHRVGHD